MPAYRIPSGSRGSVLIEGLLAIVIFSFGILGLVLLLSNTLRESANARYRSEASLLAADLVARAWSGDRSLAALRQRFGNPEAEEYRQWQQRVQAVLPGAIGDKAPQLQISDQRELRISLAWQAPGDTDAHQLRVQARITD